MNGGGGEGERTRQGGSGLPGSGRERDYGRPVAVMTGALEPPRRPLSRRDRSENYFEGGERAEKRRTKFGVLDPPTPIIYGRAPLCPPRPRRPRLLIDEKSRARRQRYHFTSQVFRPSFSPHPWPFRPSSSLRPRPPAAPGCDIFLPSVRSDQVSYKIDIPPTSVAGPVKPRMALPRAILPISLLIIPPSASRHLHLTESISRDCLRSMLLNLHEEGRARADGCGL